MVWKPPYVCAPLGGSVINRWVMWSHEFLPPGLRWHFDPYPGRLDLSRSVLIAQALDRGEDIWQWDADVISRGQTFEEMLGLIQEDTKKLGYDVVIAGHAGGNQVVMVQAVNPLTADPTKPFEVKGGCNAAWYATKDALEALKPVGWHATSDGTKFPVYCTFALPGVQDDPTFAATEDFDLSKRMRDVGLRVCCDPRLRVTHLNKRDVALRAPGEK